MFGMAVCLLMVLLALFGNLITPYGFDEVNTDNKLAPPSLEHWFGTDDLGRDLFSRVAYGARITLTVSIASVAVALVLGTVIGVTAGFIGGKVDAVLSMCIEAICAFPHDFDRAYLGHCVGCGHHQHCVRHWHCKYPCLCPAASQHDFEHSGAGIYRKRGHHWAQPL